MKNSIKFAQHGGHSRVIAVVALRLVYPLFRLLIAMATVLYIPIAGMAHANATVNALGAGGKGMEVLSGFATAPGATFTPWTVATGNSLQIRSADINSRVILLAAWAWNQVAGVLRVRSPRLHDFQQGIRMRTPVNLVVPNYPTVDIPSVLQPLVPQDTLTVEQTGSGVGGQIETGSLLVWYDSLPGISGRFIDPATVQSKGLNIIGQEVSITTGTAGGYSGQVAITSSFDNFKANTDYALLGITTDSRVATVRIQGVDTGNLGLGVPGEFTVRDLQANWFLRLSNVTGIPMVPVFNSANKSAILLDAVAQQAAVTVVCTCMLVELPANTVKPAGS